MSEYDRSIAVILPAYNEELTRSHFIIPEKVIKIV